MFMSNAKPWGQNKSSAAEHPIGTLLVCDGARERRIGQGGAGLYAYVTADPINRSDPTGNYEIGDNDELDELLAGGKPKRPKTPPPVVCVARGSRGECYAYGSDPAAAGQDQCLGAKYDDFFDENYIPALGVAVTFNVSVTNLLGLSALESAWGTSSMYGNSNNPFGATPRGDSTSGVRYNSLGSAWQNWGRQWGPRVANSGSNSTTFVNRLTQNNQGTAGRTDTRGPYNTQNKTTGGDPNWSTSVQGAIKGVQKRLPKWKPGC